MPSPAQKFFDGRGIKINLDPSDPVGSVQSWKEQLGSGPVAARIQAVFGLGGWTITYESGTGQTMARLVPIKNVDSYAKPWLSSQGHEWALEVWSLRGGLYHAKALARECQATLLDLPEGRSDETRCIPGKVEPFKPARYKAGLLPA